MWFVRIDLGGSERGYTRIIHVRAQNLRMYSVREQIFCHGVILRDGIRCFVHRNR